MKGKGKRPTSRGVANAMTRSGGKRSSKATAKLEEKASMPSKGKAKGRK